MGGAQAAVQYVFHTQSAFEAANYQLYQVLLGRGFIWLILKCPYENRKLQEEKVCDSRKKNALGLWEGANLYTQHLT